jgi:hypothetical protein
MKDKLGIFFSSLCLCHCVLTPILILLLGTNMFLGALEQEWVHKLLLLPVMIVAVSSIPKRWMATKNQWLLILSGIGLVALIGAQFHHGLSEVLLTMVGSICLICAHFLSIKLINPKTNSAQNLT